ncbi:unnamed protein product [Echinostoma caproni]|uniref:Secreted protein n=1 Tax=Echinostoma caproni TaxID=27848 RepID=A0A183AQZ7_9TREM|nr:unnamed protein product [Echinostoma caproni]
MVVVGGFISGAYQRSTLRRYVIRRHLLCFLVPLTQYPPHTDDVYGLKIAINRIQIRTSVVHTFAIGIFPGQMGWICNHLMRQGEENNGAHEQIAESSPVDCQHLDSILSR